MAQKEHIKIYNEQTSVLFDKRLNHQLCDNTRSK